MLGTPRVLHTDHHSLLLSCLPRLFCPQAFWATRNSAAAPLGRRSTSRKSSGQPETIQEVEPEQEQEQDARAAAGGESRPLLSGPNSAAASRAASSSGRHGLSVLQHHQQQQQQRKPSMDGTAGLSRRVSFNEDHRLSMGSASGRGHESAGGKSYPSVLLSPRSTEESCARGAGGPSSNVHGTMEPSAGGADSDGFSGCWSDDSADPGSRMRRLLSQQRRSRMQLKQQRSVGGMGAGYESADEGLGSSTGGGAYSECVDEEFEEPGGYTLHHLAATDSSRSGLSPGDRSYINRLSHSALHSAPVSASLSSASSRCVVFVDGDASVWHVCVLFPCTCVGVFLQQLQPGWLLLCQLPRYMAGVLVTSGCVALSDHHG